MTYELTIEQHPAYLRVIGTGTRSEENARHFLMDAYCAAVDHKYDSLLLEMRFSGPPIGIAGVYAIIAERSPDGAEMKQIAYVDVHHELAPYEVEFAELAARKQGVNVRLFCSVEEAASWLSGRMAVAAQ
jgi:hypothetical protein